MAHLSVPRRARRREAEGRVHGLAISPLLILPMAAALLAPRGLSAQARSAGWNGASASAEARARIDVGRVTKVWPDGPVSVSFEATSPGQAGPVVSPTVTRLRCAGNVPHAPSVERAGGGSAARTAAGSGRLQWSADGGETWHPLDEDLRRVGKVRPAGRHAPCATVRYRWVPGDAGDPAPPLRVEVRYRVRKAGPATAARPSS